MLNAKKNTKCSCVTRNNVLECNLSFWNELEKKTVYYIEHSLPQESGVTFDQLRLKFQKGGLGREIQGLPCEVV